MTYKQRAARNMLRYVRQADKAADDFAKQYARAAALISSMDVARYDALTNAEADALVTEYTGGNLFKFLQKSAKKFPRLAVMLQSPTIRTECKRLERAFLQVSQALDLQLDLHVLNGITEEAYYRQAFEIDRRTAVHDFWRITPEEITAIVYLLWARDRQTIPQRIRNNNRYRVLQIKREIIKTAVTNRPDTAHKQAVQERCAQAAGDTRRVIRTEAARVVQAAQARAATRAGLKKYIYIATLDEVTCKHSCARLDGLFFFYHQKIVGVNFPPMHPNCRCTTAPYITYREQAALMRSAITADGHPILVPATMTYWQWYNKYIAPAQKAQKAKGGTK